MEQDRHQSQASRFNEIEMKTKKMLIQRKPGALKIRIFGIDNVVGVFSVRYVMIYIKQFIKYLQTCRSMWHLNYVIHAHVYSSDDELCTWAYAKRCNVCLLCT